MDSESQVIREQMDQTRASLTDKLEELENKVMGSVQGASNAVRETVEEVMHTVESVKETVHDTVETVKGTVQETVDTVKGSVSDTVDTVRETFDIQHQVDKHPWMMMAGATAVGFIAGTLMTPSHNGNGHHPHYGYGYAPHNGGHQFATASHPVQEAPRHEAPRHEEQHQHQHSQMGEKVSGLLSALSGPMSQEMEMLKGMAIGAVLTMARDAIAKSVPPQFERLVDETVNTLNHRLGGQPMAGSGRGPAPRMQSAGSQSQGGIHATAGV